MTYRSTGRLSPGARVLGELGRRARRIKKPRTWDEWVGAVVVVLIAVSIAVELVRAAGGWLLSTWWAIPVLVLGGVVGACGYTQARVLRAGAAARRLATLRFTLAELDQMSPTAFEEAVRDLMIRDGLDARRVGGRGDKAADVIGSHLPSRQTVVVQCKHRTTGRKVDSKVIYEVNGTAGPAHQADIAVVVTNGGFTRDAQQQAETFRIALIGREELDRWANQGAGLDELLVLGSRIRGRRYRLRHRHEG
ncbi:restriction endonuclease [Spirillospora sp. CA-255316]